jgi:ribosome biogenesis protein NSA1
MRLYTGDECGLLKECIPELSRKKEKDKIAAPRGAMPYVSRDGVCRIEPKELQARSRGVIDMTFTGGEDESISFAGLRQNGSVELWEGSADSKSFGNYDRVYSTKNVFETSKSDEKIKPLGLGAFPKQSRICAGDMLGNLSIINDKNGKIVETYNAYATSKRGKTISYTPGKTLNTQLATAMAFDSIHGRVAVGGRERETTLIDLETGKAVFKAKNLPPDPQTLLQNPVWPSSILFLQDSKAMAVGTAYKQVRLYDIREDSKMRRPTATTSEGLFESRVMSLCQVDDYELVVGDAEGYIYSLDIRNLGRNPKGPANKNLGRYVGPAGSVRQLKKHPTLPRLAAVGLDRMLRIYDTNTRKQLDCVYLKQRLNCVLFGNDDTWETGTTEGNGVVEEGEDGWDIDQADVVQDYVDSDEEETGGNNGNMSDEGSHIHEVPSSSEDEQDDAKDQGSGIGDDSPEDDSSEAPSDEEAEGDGGSVEQMEATKTDDSDDEEIIIKAPKKRQRR